MAKKIQKQLTLWEGFPKPPEGVTENPAPLLPKRRANPWPYIVPLLLIVGILGAAYWAYQEYLAPQYAAQESAYSETLATAEKYEGEIVTKKDEGDCFSLTFDRENTIHSLCVSEELWDEQTEGKPFDLTLLRENEAEETFKLPW